ncbi:predicted protein [Streptomyces sp. C]|nr:predicted protein [Streptomyces sp. C]
MMKQEPPTTVTQQRRPGGNLPPLGGMSVKPPPTSTPVPPPWRAAAPSPAPMALGNAVLAQPAASGALPTLYAATAPGVGQDGFFGPRLGWRGAPVRSWRAGWTLDDAAGERLWAASEKLTGVTYPPL